MTSPMTRPQPPAPQGPPSAQGGHGAGLTPVPLHHPGAAAHASRCGWSFGLRCVRRSAWRWTLLLATALLLLPLVPPGPAAAAGQPANTLSAPAMAAAVGPEQLRLGAYLTGLGDFDPTRKSFSASFWVWTVGPQDGAKSLSQLEFPNAIKVESPNELQEATPQGIWSQRKIVGSFRHGWDLRRFPFDRQLLRIQMEEAERDTTSLVYVPDTANSSFDPELNLSGWRLLSTQLVSGSKKYHTSFGDPRLPPGSPSAYARAELRVLLERTDQSGFWKLTAGAFAAALMALASYGLRVDHAAALSPRFGLLAGSAFAAVISLRSAATELGASGYTTLIDSVHAAVLLYILVATAAGVVAWRSFLRHGDVARVQRLEKRAAGFSTLLFAALILALVLGAIAGQLP